MSKLVVAKAVDVLVAVPGAIEWMKSRIAWTKGATPDHILRPWFGNTYTTLLQVKHEGKIREMYVAEIWDRITGYNELASDLLQASHNQPTQQLFGPAVLIIDHNLLGRNR